MGTVTLDTELLSGAPLTGQQLRTLVDADPQMLAYILWAYARTVDIYRLAPVTRALLELEGHGATEAVDMLTADPAGHDLPLEPGAAIGIATLIAAACLGITQYADAANYVELPIDGPDVPADQVVADGVRVTSTTGVRWALSIHRVDKQSPAEHAAALADALIAWAEPRHTHGIYADALRRQADIDLLRVALDEKNRRENGPTT